MPLYKFQLGQTVFLSASPGRNVPGGACIVTRKLPERNGEFEYRVKGLRLGLTLLNAPLPRRLGRSSSFVQSHSPGTKHTCDQTAKDDVIGNVHSVVPAMPN